MERKKKKMYRVLGVLCVIAVILGIFFLNARRNALVRFAVYEAKAKSVMTSYGKLSYIDEGSGEAIISCHGICGGYDQAYDTLAGKETSYRILAPSRFGYPGSDMPDEPTIEKQAAAYAELLDALQIDKAYILATSAGGTSAIRFALTYPERTKGLILYCSGYPLMEEPEDKVSYVGPPGVLSNDLPMWLMSPLFPVIMGMEQDTIEMIMPFADKNAGIVLDSKLTNTDMCNNYQNYNLQKLQVPVLILHAKDDKLADYELAAQWAEQIPDCTFVSFEHGGHLMKGNGAAIDNALKEFIRN